MNNYFDNISGILADKILYLLNEEYISFNLNHVKLIFHLPKLIYHNKNMYSHISSRLTYYNYVQFDILKMYLISNCITSLLVYLFIINLSINCIKKYI